MRLYQPNIYKSRLHARKYTTYTTFVDIAYDSASRFALNMDFLKNTAINVRHARFRWRYVYQQFSRHVYPFYHAVR